MPGLIAIVAPTYKSVMADRVIPMAELMGHEDFYKADVFNDRSIPCTVARVHAGTVNIETQPMFNEDRSIFVIMEGEIYARQELNHTVRAANYELRNQSDAELLLRLYELKGERFVEDLNGCFLAVVHDTRENKTIIANDWLGVCPAFYVESDGVFFLSSEVKSLLLCGRVSRTVNMEKLGQYFIYDGIMDDETLIKDIRRLPNASIWTYKEGKITKRQYFDLTSFPQNISIKKQEFIEEASRLFEKIMPRYAAGNGVGLSLTGGWDTRAILATTYKLGYSLPCYTFGGPYRNSMDVTLATKIAATLGQQFTRISLGKDFFENFPEYARKAVYMSDGVANVFQTNLVYFSLRVRELAPIRLNGNFPPLQRELASLLLNGKYGYQASARRFLAKGPTFDPRILSDQYVTTMGPWNQHTRSFNDCQAAVEEFRSLWSAGFRSLHRCYLEERSPFMDRDLVSFLFSAPQSYAVDSTLQKYIVSQNCPLLIDLPTDRGAFIPTGNLLRDSRLRATLKMIELSGTLDRGYLSADLPNVLARLDPIMVRTGIERLFLGRFNLISYRRWVKYELRKFFQGVLDDERTLSRSYLNPDFVRRMTTEHFGHRANYLNEIRKIVTLELWHRQFIDTEPVQRAWQHN